VNATKTYRVIAQGDDAVGVGLLLQDAIALMESARGAGKRHVALVDEATGAIVDERSARGRIPPPVKR
jgi:hypothetical protein